MAAYLLIMRLEHSRTIRVGSFGAFDFPEGWYVYVGSAVRGMGARVARHMRRDKKLHWHVDYLTREAPIVAAWCDPSEDADECAWARRLEGMEGCRRYPERFGASDCRCGGHLVHMAHRPDYARVVAALYG